MLTLDSTIGGELANSYCDVSFVDDFWQNHFSTIKSAQWDALEYGQKEQILIQSTAIIERIKFTVPFPRSAGEEMIYNLESGTVMTVLEADTPCKLYYYQNLQFPRNIDIDSAGEEFIPEPVKLALCEQALYLVNYDESSQSKSLAGIRAESVGLGRGQLTKSTTYSDSGGGYNAAALAPLAWEYLSPYAIKMSYSMKRS